MKTKYWIKELYDRDMLCEEYMGKASLAASKKQLFDIACDANGINFMCSTRQDGCPLPYDVIKEEFKAYINGRYISEITTHTGGHYNSALYICLEKDDTVNVGTTLACFLGCRCTIKVKDFHYVRITADTNCELVIDCPSTSKVMVEHYGNASIIIKGSIDNVKLKCMDDYEGQGE